MDWARLLCKDNASCTFIGCASQAYHGGDSTVFMRDDNDDHPAVDCITMWGHPTALVTPWTSILARNML